MMIIFLLIAFVSTPVFAGPAQPRVNSAEMWWCSACGLAYPASQKFCLNKDCPKFRQRK